MENKIILNINGLRAGLKDREILKGVDLQIRAGEVHAIMGLNGSGKSTLAKVLAGHPAYEVTEGTVQFNGEELLGLEPNERAKKGIFLAFQYPNEIPGVSILNFMRTAYIAKTGKEISVLEFRKLLFEKMEYLGMDKSFATRFVNDGFSGGEKKRNEILQMAILDPKLAVLDETDSGLDIDALKVVAEGVNNLRDGKRGFLIITHYQRMLNYIEPDFVHVMLDGQIIKSGDRSLALELEERGYDWLATKEQVAI